MNRPGQDSPQETFEPLVQYLAGTLDDEAAKRLRETYGWTADGTSVLDSVLAAVREAPPEVVVDSETIARRLADARERAGVVESRSDEPILPTGAQLSLSDSVRKKVRSGSVNGPIRRPRAFGGASVNTGLRRALVAVGIAVVGLAFWLTPIVHDVMRTRQPAATSRLYVTARAQRATVTLDDGSTMVLGPQTRAQYNVDRQRGRSVELSGEAFFTVAHHRTQPFVVHTGVIETRVLGTAFDVRRYPDDSATQVTVVTGRVAVGKPHASAVLVAGTVARLTDSTVVTTASPDPLRDVAWTQDKLIFNHTPVPVVLTTLGRWYGYEFRVADTALTRESVSMEFRTDRLAETINRLKTLLGVTMSFHGHIITLHSRPTSSESQSPSIRAPLSIPEPEVGK